MTAENNKDIRYRIEKAVAYYESEGITDYSEYMIANRARVPVEIVREELKKRNSNIS